MRRASLSSAALMLVIGQLAALDHAAPVDRRPTTPTPAPRRFTDARKAEAEAKRERKQAKRARQFHKEPTA